MLLKAFVFPTVIVMHFTDLNWISKTVYCVRCVLVFRISFLLQIPEEDGENRQMQGVLVFKQTQKLHFYRHPWLLLKTFPHRGPQTQKEKQTWNTICECTLYSIFVILKHVSTIFYQILIFSPNDSPSKNMKNIFYFI